MEKRSEFDLRFQPRGQPDLKLASLRDAFRVGGDDDDVLSHRNIFDEVFDEIVLYWTRVNIADKIRIELL